MVGVVLTHTEVSTFVQQWEYALCNFKPDVVYIIGGEPRHSNVFKDAVLIDSAEDLPDAEIVLLAPQNGHNIQGEVSLEAFEHPVDAIYWFGSDARHIEISAFGSRLPDHKVFIPTDTKDQMYSFAAWVVTAWDRRQS